MSHVQCDCDVTRDLVSYVLSYGAPILATKTTLSLALNTVNSQAGPPMTESTAWWRNFRRDSTAGVVEIHIKPVQIRHTRRPEEEPLNASKDPACEISFENLETACGRVAPEWRHVAENAVFPGRSLWIRTQTFYFPPPVWKANGKVLFLTGQDATYVIQINISTPPWTCWPVACINTNVFDSQKKWTNNRPLW